MEKTRSHFNPFGKSHSNLEPASLSEVLDTFERFILLSIHVKPGISTVTKNIIPVVVIPVNLQTTDSKLADGKLNTDRRVGILWCCPCYQVNTTPVT